MALESFYGGKQGVSPVIKARFESREKLQEAFSDSTYKDVWFSELAIIDSPNKLNKDNGKVYRRTLPITTTLGNHDNDPNYAGPNAEYIGQIVGPAGGIPNVILTSLDNLKDKATGEETEIEIDSENDQILFPRKDGTSWAESNSTISSAEDFYITEGDIQQVPGQVNNTFNDKIRYSWFNLVKPATSDSEDNQTAYVYLGFEIPYPVFNFSTGVSNYNNNSTIIEKNDSKEHPYYWSYHITIPRGIRGIWQEVNLGTIDEFYNISTKTWRKNIYHNIEDLIYNEDTDSYSIRSGAPTAENDFKIDQNNFKEKDTQFWYLIVKCPKLNNQLNTENNNYPVEIDEFYFYLEDFKILDSVTLHDDNGDITLTYNNGDTKTVLNAYSYVSDLFVNEKDKALGIRYHGVQPEKNNNDKLIYSQESDRFFLKDPDTGDKVYLNGIEDIYTDYVKNIFYILFSSNSLDPKPSPGEAPSQGELDKTEKWTYRPNPDDDRDRWWYTISPIVQTRTGVRILTTLSLLDDYLPFKSNEQEKTEENLLIALNSAGENWDNNKNPYEDGQNGFGGSMDGQFGVYGGYAFYYDKLSKNGTGEWKSIGSWADSASSSHEIYLNDDDKRSTDYSIGLYFSDPDIINDKINWPNLEF